MLRRLAERPFSLVGVVFRCKFVTAADPTRIESINVLSDCKEHAWRLVEEDGRRMDQKREMIIVEIAATDVYSDDKK